MRYHNHLRKELAMAILRNRGEKWYARVKWYVKGIRYQKEKLIPLKTESKVIAITRLEEVNKKEDDIKLGIMPNLSWLPKTAPISKRVFTLQDAINQWLQSRRKHIRKSTQVTNEYGLKYLTNAIGLSMPMDQIDNSHILLYISYLERNKLSVTSINIHLRTVKTMMRHYSRLDKLKKMPIIQQLKVPKKDPIYITEEELNGILKLNWLDDLYKELFVFYRDTGVRLREPFIATLNGNWMDIPPESKSHSKRHILLNEEQVSTYMKLQLWLEEGAGKKLKDPGNHISRRFKKALRDIKASEDKHFHSLRHTFAVRSLLKGVSIYEVKIAMGHASVTTTEVYVNMNLKRIAHDFPSLVGTPKNKKRDIEMRDKQVAPTMFMHNKILN